MHRRRLKGEAVWDALHAAAGTLNPARGGRPTVPPLSEDELGGLRERWQWPVSADPADHTRRGLYMLARRGFRFPLFEAFDAPVDAVSCPRREVTTVAPQALWLLNNPVAQRQAKAFTERVPREAGQSAEARVDHAWRLALGRAPSAREAERAVRLEREQGLRQLCLALFNLNEFVHVD